MIISSLKNQQSVMKYRLIERGIGKKFQVSRMTSPLTLVHLITHSCAETKLLIERKFKKISITSIFCTLQKRNNSRRYAHLHVFPPKMY